MIDDYDLSRLVEPLQTWFVENARQLPWRAKIPGQKNVIDNQDLACQDFGPDEPNPYYVWISEIMLQQTRVEAVKPYFKRFIQVLPDVAALAVCPEEELLKLWEGLGYYNRARNLKIAAQQIMKDYGGQLPADYEELLKLKGIGHYTAGAIASIAYGLPVPAVDGNVLRVLSRVMADDSDIMKQSVRKHMEDVLGRLMRTYMAEGSADGSMAQRDGRAGGASAIAVYPPIFNQALMELGALVCVPNGEPHCEECPWGKLCLARAQNRIGELPVKTKAKKRRIVEMTVLVIRSGSRVAIHKRPGDGLLAGLYELPNQEGYYEPETILEQLRERGYQPCHIEELPEAKHIFSHVEWHMRGYAVEIGEIQDKSEDISKSGDLLFVEVTDVREYYAIPAAFARYVKYLDWL